MEIKINIPNNDYKEPTEVRQEVVQEIASFLCERIRTSKNHTFEICVELYYDRPSELWLVRRNDNDEMCNIESQERYDRNYSYEKIFTAEMVAVFKALSDAEYICYGRYCVTDQTHTYTFTDRDFRPDQSRFVKFTDFID